MSKDKFQREERYVVFKLSDVADYFHPSEISQLFRLSSTQQVVRERNGKPPLECVVVESDWPEYEPTWKAIEARVTGAQPAPSAPEGWIQRGMAELEAIRSRHDDDTLLDDRTLIERIGKAMLAAATEAKP